MLLSKSIVDETRNWVYNLIKESDDHEFEMEHIKNVEAVSLELAEKRTLDLNISSVIALLHDVGRIKDSVVGKAHSKRSAEIAVEYLEQFGLELDLVKTIEQAIKYHNKKKRFGKPYDELIKDADCKAHFLEGIDLTFKPFEEARIKCLEYGNLELKVCDQMTIYNRFSEAVDKFYGYFTKKRLRNFDYRDVHDLRVQIRAIRTLIWLIKDDAIDGNKLLKMDKILKMLFHYLEDARINYVFMKEVKDLHEFKRTYKALKKRQKILDSLLHKLLIKFSTEGELDKLKATEYEPWTFKQKPRLKYERYRNALISADIKDIDSIHTLRVEGKKMKYLIELGIIKPEHDFFICTLYNLHTFIGRLHDMEENERLLERKEFCEYFKIEKKQKNVLIQKYDIERETLLKDIQLNILIMKKLYLKD